MMFWEATLRGFPHCGKVKEAKQVQESELYIGDRFCMCLFISDKKGMC